MQDSILSSSDPSRENSITQFFRIFILTFRVDGYSKHQMPRILFFWLGKFEPSAECIILRESLIIASNNLKLSFCWSWNVVFCVILNNFNMPFIPILHRYRFSICNHLFKSVDIVNKSSILNWKHNIFKLPIESRVPIQIFPTKDKV